MKKYPNDLVTYQIDWFEAIQMFQLNLHKTAQNTKYFVA